jgi:hypothetical protein
MAELAAPVLVAEVAVAAEVLVLVVVPEYLAKVVMELAVQ